MSSVIANLSQRNIINCPPWMKDNIMFEAMSGSVAYGVPSESSDHDYIAWCIPPKSDVFYTDEIPNFGKKKDRFLQYQQHHIKYETKEYDVTCYSVVRYFDLCMENNPNLIETLFYPVDVITQSTMISNLVRDNRKLFLHKGSYYRLKSYAYSQLSKALAVSKDPLILKIRKFEEANDIPSTTTFENLRQDINHMMSVGYSELGLSSSQQYEYERMFLEGFKQTKRFENQKIHLADTKFLYHLARLTNYCRQILTEGDLDVRQDREYWKAIRRGEVDTQLLQAKFEEEERQLQKLFETSKLQAYPDEKKIYNLLLSCLESHYGNIPVSKTDECKQALIEIQNIIGKIKLYS